MTGGIQIVRSLLIYGMCLPLALFLGYSLANPYDVTTLTVVGLVVLLLLTPALLRWHHPLLFLVWNTSAVAFFIRGQPPLWLVIAAVSLVIVALQRALNPEMRFLVVPSIIWPLLFLAVVVVVTAECTGGFGFRALGGELIGGKRYLMLLGGIAGYFALTSQPIPPNRAMLYAGLYILGGATAVIGSLAWLATPGMNLVSVLFLIFPPEATQTGFGFHERVFRITGLSFASVAITTFMLARYGIRGIFLMTRPWRLLAFLFFVGIGLLGGFRTSLALLLLIFGIQFYLEGLFRSRLLLLFILAGALGLALLIPLARQLPRPVQRAMAFLPIEVDPVVRMDAQGSSEWRFQMWRVLLPEVPRYLLLGKGLGFSAADLAMSQTEMRSGFETGFYSALLSGDYHNGPLSVVIPFGIWGMIGFLWFLAAAWRLLYRNYRYGDESLHTINTFLLAYFIANALLFLLVVGGFYTGLAQYTGMVGLSVALNGGMRKPAVAPALAAAPHLPVAPMLPRLVPGR